MRTAWVSLFALWLAHGAAGAVLSRERVVLHTTVGDIVIALYPKAAPNHYSQIIRLVRLGVYDDTPFAKIDHEFAVQVDGVMHRRAPLTEEQRAAVHTLKAEFNSEPHRYGTVTMAHNPNDPDSAETSFLIMLNTFPQMNGKFTVVGEVVEGVEILEALRFVPADLQHKPLQDVRIQRAEVSGSPEALSQLSLRLRGPAMEPMPQEASGAAVLILALGAVLFAFSFVFSGGGGGLRAVGLIAILAGYFMVFALLAPAAPKSPGLAVGLFFSAVGLFKLMSYFERGRVVRRNS